mmetsp:Transcript_26134/g.72965  ORF Transcript_26134/g.72965 Transcript_26134/m.72965 type:complete len:593 (-) Transcript_26134:23-1801(-)
MHGEAPDWRGGGLHRPARGGAHGVLPLPRGVCRRGRSRGGGAAAALGLDGRQRSLRRSQCGAVAQLLEVVLAARAQAPGAQAQAAVGAAGRPSARGAGHAESIPPRRRRPREGLHLHAERQRHPQHELPGALRESRGPAGRRRRAARCRVRARAAAGCPLRHAAAARPAAPQRPAVAPGGAGWRGLPRPRPRTRRRRRGDRAGDGQAGGVAEAAVHPLPDGAPELRSPVRGPGPAGVAQGSVPAARAHRAPGPNGRRARRARHGPLRMQGADGRGGRRRGQWRVGVQQQCAGARRRFRAGRGGWPGGPQPLPRWRRAMRPGRRWPGFFGGRCGACRRGRPVLVRRFVAKQQVPVLAQGPWGRRRQGPAQARRDPGRRHPCSGAPAAEGAGGRGRGPALGVRARRHLLVRGAGAAELLLWFDAVRSRGRRGSRCQARPRDRLCDGLPARHAPLPAEGFAVDRCAAAGRRPRRQRRWRILARHSERGGAAHLPRGGGACGGARRGRLRRAGRGLPAALRGRRAAEPAAYPQAREGYTAGWPAIAAGTLSAPGSASAEKVGMRRQKRALLVLDSRSTWCGTIPLLLVSSFLCSMS